MSNSFTLKVVMGTKEITVLIGKSIREGKYLKIVYRNKAGVKSPFWICIKDINAKGELRVDMFNVTKDEPIFDGKIFISEIQKAEILLFSHYEVSQSLIKKLEEDESLQVYQFNKYDSEILNYYIECYRANKDPFLYKSYLIEGIDLNHLVNENPYSLSDQQLKQIIKDIYHDNYKSSYKYELVLSDFAIDINAKGKFVIAYRKIKFDPVRKKLFLDKNIQFNPSFYIKEVKHTLSYYSNLSQADFEAKYKEGKLDIIAIISENFKSGELINTRPEIVSLGYSQIDISSIYENINSENKHNQLETPLKAFFQNGSLLDRKNRKEPHIVLYDNNINIDQIRTIYNSLKFPITYVQGPPGTGKTQTLINILINCILNNKTLLITSNNNVPIDGIIDKISLGKYKGREITLPLIRLGNNEYVGRALKVLKNLFSFRTKDVPKEQLLINLKEQSKRRNLLLSERLKQYEDRIDINQNLEFVNALLANGKNHLLNKEKEKLEKQLAELPNITIEDISSIYETISGNNQLLQFFYFESLKYSKRINSKEFNALKDIVSLEEEQEQIKEFNKWISNDENLEKFTRVFPIILTTNLSARNLGSKFKFDLLAIDEAGQCDIATSLIPISKCKSMVLIGDTNQLKPIVVFDERRNNELLKSYNIEESYSYFDNSILSVYKKIDNISRDILLSYHYRCGKSIINFSNMRYYDSKLNLSDNQNLGEVKLLEVASINATKRNASVEEAIEIVKYIKENKIQDAFIITPFRNQEEVINSCLKLAQDNGEINSSISCGTIHKVQGRENETIIISTALTGNTSSKTYDWVKNNSELINVGVTRAKNKLVVVTDPKAIDILSRKDDDLYALIDYVRRNGEIKVAQSSINKYTIGLSNDSIFEDEFYKTMSHYCTVESTRFRRNVKLIEIFPDETNNSELQKKEFDGVLYDGKHPRIIFEINGREHINNKKRIEADKIKMRIAKDKNIKLIFIPNQYVKHYEFIGELIKKIKGDLYQKTLFDF